MSLNEKRGLLFRSIPDIENNKNKSFVYTDGAFFEILKVKEIGRLVETYLTANSIQYSSPSTS